MNIDIYYQHVKKEHLEKQKLEVDEDYERLMINELFVTIKNEDNQKFNLLLDKVNLLLPFSFNINYVGSLDNENVLLEVENKYYNVLQAAIVNLESDNKFLNQIINKYEKYLKNKDEYNKFSNKYVQYEIIKSALYDYKLMQELINKKIIEQSSFNEYVYIHNYYKNEDMELLINNNIKEIMNVYINYLSDKKIYMYNTKNNMKFFLDTYINKYIKYETDELERKDNLEKIFKIYKELSGYGRLYLNEMSQFFKPHFLKLIAIEDIDINKKITSKSIKDEFNINAKDLEDVVKYKYEILSQQTNSNNQNKLKTNKI